MFGGCRDNASVQLIPILPADEPGLLADTEVTKLIVTPFTANTDDNERMPEPLAPIEVLRGESLVLEDFPAGKWRFEISGFRKQGETTEEVVYGETAAFEVVPGAGGTVSFFLGRSFAFNLVSLEPAHLAAALVGLVDHTVTGFHDDSDKEWILVAGGRQGIDGAPLRHALLIDPESFRIEEIQGGLHCERAGHAAFTVQTNQGLRIILSGGDERCPGTLDVFDPAERTFSGVQIDCPVASTGGAIPQTSPNPANEKKQTGYVIVPGANMCVIDPLDGRIVESEKLSGDFPQNVTAVAVDRAGKKTVFVADGRVFIDFSWENMSCHEAGVWQMDAVWENVNIPPNASLLALSDDRFLLVSGGGDEEDQPDFGWALIALSLYGCRFEDILVGPWDSELPGFDFAATELDLGWDVTVLFTGGRKTKAGPPTDSVFILHKQEVVEENAPSWHDLTRRVVGSRPLRLRSSRAGHAVAELQSGAIWIIGGGEQSDGPVEVFLRGSNQGLLDFEYKGFTRRNPPRISMAVLDTTPGTKELLNRFASSYPDHLYGQGSGESIMFLYSAADRGIGGDLLGSQGSDAGTAEGCKSVDTALKSHVTEVRIDDSEGGGENDTGGGSQKSAAQTATEALAEFAAENHDDCSWRQLARVGFDGLQYGGLVDPENRPSARMDSVNLLMWVTSGDDCSQGLLRETGIPPQNNGILARCEDEEFDEYFWPESWRNDFVELINSLVLDPKDLIVAVVGNTSLQDTCLLDETNIELRRPRRLLGLEETLNNAGASMVTVNACGDVYIGNSVLDIHLAEWDEAVQKRNYLQTCVPTSFSSEMTDGGVVNEQPSIAPRSFEAEEVAKQIEEQCQVIAVLKNAGSGAAPSDELYDYVLKLERGSSGWSVRNTAGRRENCENNWLVTLSDQIEQELGDVSIVCLD